MERIAEQPWSSSYTYQVRQHSAEMLHNLDAQRKDGGRFCDVILRVGDESFPAHKAVLAACSEYFESVFSCQAETDSESKELEMHTISAKVFKDILDFAYTSRIVVRLECFPELMTAAKFLLMRSVIEICQEVIKQSNVQILVPPSRAGDVSFPRAATASDLSYAAPSDGPGGTLANGAVFPGSGQAHDADADASQAVAPDVTGSPFPGAGSPGSKRGRGRPKKPAAMEPVLFHSGHASKETGVFPCGICGKIFTEAVRLRNHEAQHDTPAMASPSGLLENGVPADGAVDGGRKRERIRRHVGCDICGKVFRDVYHLNRHKLSHSGEKPYACQVCGLRFKRKDRMSYHVRSHDGSVGKPYVCQSCGKGFSRPDHLNGHIKQVHTTERPHKCQICNASFATRDRLRSHLACHEDKIPCQVCGKFLRAAYMTDHLKKHSEGPHNYCSICNKGFSTASYLKVHIKTHHGSSLLSAPATHAFPDPHGEPQTHNGAPYPMGRQCAVEEGQENSGKCPHQDSEGSDTSFGELSNGTELKSPHKVEGEELSTAFICNGVSRTSTDVSSVAVSPPKHKVDPDKKYPCSDCGQAFRTKSYLNKHYQRMHGGSAHKGTGVSGGPGVGDMAASLSSPFSPQQNMSLLESFGFQIVQSAFASSLVDSEVGSSGIGLGEK